MLAIERKNEILEKLKIEQRVVVSELAAFYQVTEETIRRDLDKLEKKATPPKPMVVQFGETVQKRTFPTQSETRPMWKPKP